MIRSAAFFLSIPAMLLAGAPVRAMEQGMLGAASHGSVTITASVAARTSLSGLHDTALVAGKAALDVCARSNTPTRLYSLQAAAAAGEGDAAGARYNLGWDDGAGATAPDRVANPYGGPCGRHRLVVVAGGGSATAAQAGTLTLLVSPD